MKRQTIEMVMAMAIGVAVLGILGLVGAEDHREVLRRQEEHRRWESPTMRIEDPLVGWEWE